jgi:glycerol-3-phosphate acyltransferase PlsX
LKKSEQKVVVALDAAGGENGIKNNVDAAIGALSEINSLNITLVGRKPEIEKYLKKSYPRIPRLSIFHAEGVVDMQCTAIQAAKDEKNSIVQGIELVKAGKADAFVSIGHTGAVTAASLLRLGTLQGIKRTPILTIFPTTAQHVMAVLDVGANVDCKPEHLVNFAMLGSKFAQVMMGVENPKVGLISIGEEKSKGNAAVKGAYKILMEISSDLKLNFIGNVEGRDILEGTADVLVCDGFIGNILLKYTEGIFSLVKKLFRVGRRFSMLSLIGGLFMYPAVKRTISDFNYAEYGGAPLLGINGNVVIGHGSSSSKAVKNAIIVGYNMGLVHLPEVLKEAAKNLEACKDAIKNIGNRSSNS